MFGKFTFWFPAREKKIIIPNLIVDQGKTDFIKMIVLADTSVVASGGNFYIGLASDVAFAVDSTLSDITDEPSGNGYSRQAVERNSTGWPTIDVVNGQARAQSKVVTFSATGGDWDKTIKRAFLCNVSSGSTGRLFAFSGALEDDLQVSDGENFQVQYEVFI